jgi:hypothetical protein
MAEKFIQIFIKHIYLKIENEDIYKRREQGTGNREQVRNTHLHQFKAQSKKDVF